MYAGGNFSPAYNSTYLLPALGVFINGAFAEEKGYTPDSGKADKGVYNSADCCSLPAKQIGNYIKPEYTDTAPVETADDS